MPIRSTIVGSFPKVTETGSDNLPGTIDKWQRQLAGEEALEQEVQKVIRRVIQEQEQAGLDLITDGQVRWEDLPHPVARSARGLKRGALRRFFDNNVYYRRLELENGVQWQKSSVAQEFQFASTLAKKPVKVSLPGPLTLVISTEIETGQTPEKLLALYTGLLRKEMEALVAAGAKEIQIDEPALRPGEPLLNQAIEAINKIFQGIKAKRWVALYFHDVSSILPALSKLQVEVLSIDLVSGPKVTDRLKELNWAGELALGIVDGRNTKLESARELSQQVQKIAQTIPAQRLWVTSSCGLEFLPHEAAVKKLQLLREVARA